MTAPTGSSTMSPAMAELRAYPAYLFHAIEKSLGSRVLEIGVGYGTYTEMLLGDSRSVRATDVAPECVREVLQRFAENSHLTAGTIDLTDLTSIRRHADFQADSIVCFNVLEHIEDDRLALEALRQISVAGARLMLIVPAHQWLYGRMDQEAGHYRRYTRASLARVMTAAGWSVERCRYINFVGMLGWFYHNRLRQNAGLGDVAVNRQMRWIDAWLPRFAAVTDCLTGRVAGLSVLAVGRSD